MLIVCAECLATNRLPAERTGDNPACGRCGRPLLDGRPVELGDASFDAVATKTELPLVVDFWAPWCGPCRAMAPQFEQAAMRLRGRALFAKVNSDESPRLSARFAVRSIPTLLLLSAGAEVRRQAGAISEAQIVAWVGSIG